VIKASSPWEELQIGAWEGRHASGGGLAFSHRTWAGVDKGPSGLLKTVTFLPLSRHILCALSRFA